MKTIKFNSLTELQRAANDTPDKTTGKNAGNSDFFGTENFEAANMLLETGCPDIVKGLIAAVKMQRAAGTVSRIRPVNAIVGSLANVPAALAGIPESMIDYKRNSKTAKCKIVNIYYNNCYNSDARTDQIIAVGGAVLNMIKNAENAGYQTNVFITKKSRKNRGGAEILITVPVKGAGQKLSVSKLSYPFAHPSFLRRHMFAICAANDFDPSCTHAVLMTDSDVTTTGQNIIINGVKFTHNPAGISELFKA